MNNLFTKREIALLVFIFGGLAVGWGVDGLTAKTGELFPEPAQSVETKGPSTAQVVDEPLKLVNVNLAPIEELVRLPSIGPVIAERIIEDREQNGLYKKPEDLLRVKGIGQVTLGKIKPYIIFSN